MTPNPLNVFPSSRRCCSSHSLPPQGMTEPCASPAASAWSAGNLQTSLGESTRFSLMRVHPLLQSVSVPELRLIPAVCPQVRTRATFPQLSVREGRAHAERAAVGDAGHQSRPVPQQRRRLRQDRLLRFWQLSAVSGGGHQEGKDLHLGRLQDDEGQKMRLLLLCWFARRCSQTATLTSFNSIRFT